MSTEDLLEAFDERAAIMEFDGGLTRAEAEEAAMLLLTGEPLTGVAGVP